LGEIDCVCQTLTDGLKIIIYDTGCFFNPEGIPTPDVHQPLTKRTEGGLGLFFMRSLMDEVIFDPCKDSGTSLTMIKRKQISKRG
jgi:serine/threonine-protein kinase RsbW